MCTHHWIVNEQNYGICKKCENERQFPLWIEITDDDHLNLQARQPEMSEVIFRALQILEPVRGF